MLGKSEKQLTVADLWLEGKIPESSYWNKIRKWACETLTEEMFQPLFSYYGRSSISPVHTFVGLLIQMEKNYSDKEFEEESRFDDRIKYALGASRNFEGIDSVTLHDHRTRFFNSEFGREIFLKVLSQAKNHGLFSEENLHVIDSFMVWGKSARQDTYSMIYQAIKMLLNLLKLDNTSVEKLVFIKGKDYYKDRKKPEVNWDDDKDKKRQLNRLVKDALGLVVYTRKKAKPECGDLLSAADLLERVATQDVEKDKNGIYKIKQGTAKERVISVNDPDMRHGCKTSSKIQDGYKSEIITGGNKGEIVLGVKTDSANTADGTYMGELIDEADESGYKINKLYGDSAYCGWEEIEKREGDMEFCVKVSKASNRKGFYTKDDFNIDVDKGEVICPAGEIANFNP